MKQFLLISAFLLNFACLNAQVNQNNKKTDKSISLPVRTKIDKSKLLKPIKDNVAKAFPDAKIYSAYKNEAKGVITYSVHVAINDKKWSLIYDSKGKYIKKEEIKPPPSSTPAPKK